MTGDLDRYTDHLARRGTRRAQSACHSSLFIAILHERAGKRVRHRDASRECDSGEIRPARREAETPASREG
jgi:hypothetical protein